MCPNLADDFTHVVVDVAANSADHVEVIVGVSQLPASTLIRAKLRLANQVEVRKQCEGPVNGRRIDRSIRLVHLDHDLLDRHVPIRLVEHFPHSQTRFCQAIASITEQGAELGFDTHLTHDSCCERFATTSTLLKHARARRIS